MMECLSSITSVCFLINYSIEIFYFHVNDEDSNGLSNSTLLALRLYVQCMCDAMFMINTKCVFWLSIL